MFIPLWLVFLLTGLAMAVLTVVWAIRSGQFEDQQRARYLPLVGLTAEEMAWRPTRRFRAEHYGTWTIIVVGFCAVFAALLLTLRQL